MCRYYNESEANRGKLERVSLIECKSRLAERLKTIARKKKLQGGRTGLWVNKSKLNEKKRKQRKKKERGMIRRINGGG